MNIFGDNLFAGRVALVTGGGTGIARGIVEGLAALGAATAILSRKAEHLEPAAQAVTERFGQPCVPLVADVRRPEQVEAAVAQALDRLGKIDILVNAAAGNFLCSAADLSYNGFGTVLDIDAKGTWNVSKAVYASWMRAHGGQILNLSATLHYGGTPGQLHVSAAKAAVDALTRNLAVEWGPQGIRVNAIAPGPIADTEGARRLFPGDEATKLQNLIPTRRLGTIADVVNLALFVLSDAAANINGAIFVTDGGLCLAGHFPMAPPAPQRGE
jgi:2,4-dienoyl-CoA reductase [(3E)-enoyl-CoA-producing], peroxisomal